MLNQKKSTRNMFDIFLDITLFSIIISSTMFIIGCSSTKYVYIDKPIPVYKPLPPTLIIDDVTLPKPPNEGLYLEADPIQRERMLTENILTLYKTIGMYKLKLVKIRTLDKELRNLYPDDINITK